MKSIKYITCFFFLLFNLQILSQEKKILIFDPNNVSTSFQSSFFQLSPDSIFVADTIDENINNFDALFLFFGHPFVLSEEEGSKLIEFTSNHKPVYIYTLLGDQNIDSVAFWNHIGIASFAGLATSVLIDSVVGVNNTFTQNSVIDTSFMSGYIPVVWGNVDSILIGIGDGWKVNTTFSPEYDSLNVIIDLYNLIHHPEFLEKVIEKFDLNALPKIIVSSPNGGEHWLIGQQHDITWTTNEVDSVKIELSLHNGYLWYTLTQSTPSDGIYEWVVQAPQTSWECKIKITDVNDSTLTDESDTTFVIDIFPSVDDSTESIIPSKFDLLQNYPNPFNPTTKISYQISHQEFVSIKVYDVLGNEITILVNEEKPGGSYEVEFNASSIPSGVYFYQIKAGSYIETKKMVLLK